MLTFRDEEIERVLNKIVEDNNLLNRVHAFYYLAIKEYPENMRLKVKFDYMNNKINKEEAFSVNLLSNLRRRLIRFMINGCDFKTVYMFYLKSLKLKNSHNPDGWEKFGKIGEKGLKEVYFAVQKRKAYSFTDFEAMINDERMRKKDGLEFFREKYAIDEPSDSIPKFKKRKFKGK